LNDRQPIRGDEVSNPIQPLVTVNGIERFKANTLVSWLLDNGSKTMNDLARVECSDDDRQQFAQLIGYSLFGYCDLSYRDAQVVQVAESLRDKAFDNEKDSRIAYLEEQLDNLRTALREPMAELFDRHPDDLMELMP
jgi:hypothetical protein